jgi:hypothetical protein
MLLDALLHRNQKVIIMSNIFEPVVATKSEPVNLNVRLPKSVRDDFANLCTSKGLSISEVIRRMMVRELETAGAFGTETVKSS